MRQEKIKYLLILTIIYQVMSFFIAPLLIAYLFKSTNYFTIFFVQMVSFCIPIIAVLFLSYKGIGENEEEMTFDVVSLYKRKITIASVFLGIFMGLLLSVGIHYILHFVEVITILITEDVGVVSILPETNLRVILGAIIVICFIPSIFEELLFRGMYYDTLEHSQVKWQFIIPTLIFASSHGSIFSFVSVSLISIVLIIFMRNKQSLIVCTAVHFVYNVGAIILSNVTTLPLSSLRLLESYASNQVLIAALLFYAGIIIFISAIVLLILNSLHKKTIQANNPQIQTIFFEKNEKIILYALVLISVLMYMIRIFI